MKPKSYVYHLVTRRKMIHSQEIHFGNGEVNTLSRFFLDKHITDSKGQDFYDILNRFNSADSISLDHEESSLVMNYADTTARSIREVILEMVRLQGYSHRPSRLSCLYAARTFDEVMRWKKIFESYNRSVLQIVRLSFDGGCFIGDANLLPKANGDSFSMKIEQARKYWEGNIEISLPEVIIDGNIRVEEIVEEF